MYLMVLSGLIASALFAFLLGYLTKKFVTPKSKEALPRDYLIGLNLLLNEETDKAVDVFVKMLEVDSETVETHLAVAKLFRKQGEVDRAIRIHENLIARPQLEKVYREQALFELGQDYLSAGMLDRAEGIFEGLSHSSPHAANALKFLVDIYQQEKDWKKAIHCAERYEAVSQKKMHPTIAHFYCECAEIDMNHQLETAKNALNTALKADKHCVRANLLHAKIAMQEEDFSSAIKFLKQIKQQNARYLSEAIELLAICYEKCGQEKELVEYLKKLLQAHPHVPVVLILAERIQKWKGDKVASGFVADYVRRYPSLPGLSLFIDLYLSSAEGRAKEDLTILQNLMHNVLADKPEYQCASCGFGARSLHWQCPGCRRWGTVAPMHSLHEAAS